MTKAKTDLAPETKAQNFCYEQGWEFLGMVDGNTFRYSRRDDNGALIERGDYKVDHIPETGGVPVRKKDA